MLAKRLVGSLKFCPGKHQFVKNTFCGCTSKCNINPTLSINPINNKKKSLIHCAFDNKLIDCKYCDTMCSAKKSELMFYFDTDIN